MWSKRDRTKHKKTVYVSSADGTAVPVDEFSAYMDFVRESNRPKDELISFLEKKLESTNKDIKNLENENIQRNTVKTSNQTRPPNTSHHNNANVEKRRKDIRPSEGQFLYDPDDRIDVVLPDVTVIRAGGGFVPAIKHVRDSYKQ